jgi:RHS repeat-associated protein
VLRGRVFDSGGLLGVPRVRITVVDHPEFGQTATRADGRFDLAVNGGETLTLNYEKEGLLPLQRQETAPWQEFVDVDDIVMKAFDVPSEVDLGAAGIQVAEASPVNDADGQRQAVLMFDPGTDAVMELPDGSTKPLGDDLDVRATEFTVGAAGDEAMPGELPTASGYTYAVELSVDQAVDAGAATVTFDRPVASYVDNFLDFPAGNAVPAAYYDRERAAWVPAEDGIVIKIVGESSGAALIDADDDGNDDPSSAAALAALGLDLAERQKLAQLYDPGKSLWRVQVKHFTPWDYNWPYGLNDDAEAPSNPEDQAPPCPECEGAGSVIGFLNQSLGENLRLRGTPFSLHYSSDRVPGYTEAYTVDVPVSGPSLPPSVRGIEVNVTVGGQTFSRSLPAAPNQTTTFTWDGKDAYGRTVSGAQAAVVQVGYTYQAVYLSPERLRRSFARFGERPMTADRARREITLFQEWTRPLGTPSAQLEQAVGGWTLDIHHSYDPAARTLFLGDGGKWTTDAIHPDIHRVAGGGRDNDDGGPALEAELGHVRGLAVGPDGTLYIAATETGRIRHVKEDGTIETVAGGGSPPDGLGDGLPATQAALGSPSDVDVGPDGAIYISDTGNGRIRRVGPDGVIATIAGGGTPGVLGDDGPATSAWLNRPRGLALGADGSVYVADTFNDRVRRITPDGTIATAAGGGSPSSGVGDGGLSIEASLRLPYDVALDADGTLYVADGGHYRIRSVRSDGQIETVAGTGRYGYSGDGGPATDGDIGDTQGLGIGRDGAIYATDRAHNVVRRIDGAGTITTYAGTGVAGDAGELGPPAQAQLALPQDVAVAPNGVAYIADSGNGTVRTATPGLPGFEDADLTVPSQDGREVYQFNATGRHIRTVDALTGALRYRFEYDAAGRLLKAIDADGDTTEIVRDGLGRPTKVVASGGQETVLTVDGNGYLATAANPLTGQITHMQTKPNGLLESFTDPRGGTSEFFYDSRGRLIRDENAANGFTSLVRSETGSSTTVTATTALGRSTQYVVTRLPDGATKREVIEPSGARLESIERQDGTSDATDSDGTKLHLETGPDPRWGMRAPLVTKVVRTWPSGRTDMVERSRTVTLLDSANPFALETLVDSSVRNGRHSEVTYVGATRTSTSRSAAGRNLVEVFDARGRVLSRRIAASVAPVLYEYDSHGRPKKITSGAESQTFTYDPQNRLTERTDALGRRTKYTYDGADRVSQLELPSGRKYGFTYDANGNRTSIVMPNGTSTHSLAYSALDQAVGYTPPGSAGYTRAYDDDKLPLSFGFPSGRSMRNTRDAPGRITALEDRVGAIVESSSTFTYGDMTSRVTRSERLVDDALVQATAFDYDGGLATSRASSGAATGTFAYTYDANSFLKQITLTSGADTVTTNYARDLDGFVVAYGPFTVARAGPSGAESAITDSALNLQLAYDGLGRTASRTHAVGATPLYRVAVERDNAGRISRRVETVGGAPTTLDYTYDADGRLARVAQGATTLELYSYDPNGNRTGGLTPAQTATYDAQDRLTSIGGVAYSFDADGFLAQRGGDTFQYDVQGQLLSATAGGQIVTYAYDAAGRRVARTQGGQRYEYLYGHPSRQFLITAARSPSGQLTSYYYDDRGFLFALQRGASRFYVGTDQVGSPRVVSSSAGAIVKRIDYDSFGNVVADTAPGFDLPFGFAGGLRDDVTRLVRFGFRDYDPAAGRWTARDPIFFQGGEANLYVYVGNDPIGSRDPTGLFEWPTWGQVKEFAKSNWGKAVDAVNSLEVDSKVLDGSRWLKGKYDKVSKALELQDKVQDTYIEVDEALHEGSDPEQAAGLLKCGLKILKEKLPLDLIGLDAAEAVLDKGMEHAKDVRDLDTVHPVQAQRIREAFEGERN